MYKKMMEYIFASGKVEEVRERERERKRRQRPKSQ